MKPKVYVTNHQHSRVIGLAFSEGCNGQLVPPNSLLEGPAAMYGILRGTGDIIKQCQWIGRDYYYIDHGYFRPSDHSKPDYSGYYRVTKNGMQASGEGSRTEERWKDTGVEIKPWRRRGRHILLCPISGFVAKFLSIDPEAWTKVVIEELARHTNRPVLIKEKGYGDINDSLNDAWCVVTHSSNSAIDALVEGVPAVVLGESAAYPVSWDFEDIETPVWPEREPWCYNLAYDQFTLDEMRSGYAWSVLNGED